MQFLDDRFVFSASDLSSFIHCAHLVTLRQQHALGTIEKPYFDDPTIDALARRGIQHEKAFIAQLKANGLDVVEIERPHGRGVDVLEAHAIATREAMRAGAGVIYQGALFDGTWLGFPDFLIKVLTASDLGDYSYEVVDTKLARSARGHALLQVLLYTELLGAAQGHTPERVGLALAGPNAHTEYFRVRDYDAYYRSIKRRFLEGVRGNPPLGIAPDPVEHCGICEWSSRCADERVAVDHLSLVAGISRRHTAVLRREGINTLAQLGEMDVPAARPADIAQASFERIQSQARLQLEGRKTGRNIHELLVPIVEGQGLAALPAPSAGDVYFDLESDNNAFGDGIEYLWGITDRDGNYLETWALDPGEEKAAFEQFVDYIVGRKRQFPDMHVYHYSAHEITALTHIMSRYGTRENDVDDLLRGEVFVDLLRVVRQSLRASVDSYSIKALEPFYGFARSVLLPDARKALAQFELWLEFREDIALNEVRATITGYNHDDCDSMLHLQNWLELLRDGLIASGTTVPRPPIGARLRDEARKKEDEELVALRERLLDGIPLIESERTPEQHAQWLLANLLGYHNREDKSYWWSYFDRLDMSADECEEDRKALGNLEFVGMVPQRATPTGRKRADAARYKYPPQEHDFKKGTTAKHKGANGEPQTVGTVVAVDETEHTIDLRMHRDFEGHPDAIVPHDWINPEPKPSSLLNIALAAAEGRLLDVAPYACARQLLLRAKPRLTNDVALRQEHQGVVDAGRRLVRELDRTVLPVQGPPGAGKTYLGARMILDAVAAGRTVGVTAPSHAVICNLLDQVFRAADEEGRKVTVVQKPSNEGEKCERAEAADKNGVIAALAGAAQIAAGTSWLWADEELQQSVDILFIDEGGQFSLADALAVARAASSMVILGDPQQLDQPRKGVHPEGCDVSVLEHLLNGRDTIADDRGLFLDQTWRLHPEICRFTSEIFYSNRLESRPDLELQMVAANGDVKGAGLRLLLVPHADNQNNSIEEAEAIAALIEHLVGREWTDKNGASAPLSIDDVVIVAPYNAQVDRIRKVARDVRVGTVDKFQGQEAPVAIYSLASSSADDAPRGMQFLYSPNRFNVATSRGRCMAIVVASPAVFTPDCKTPEQMRFANAFCRYLEMAVMIAPPDTDNTPASVIVE